MIKGFEIRQAVAEDSKLIVEFAEKLAKYQHMEDKLLLDEEKARELISEGFGEAVFGELDGKTAAFIYYYYSSSAFLGERGIYIDMFYVEESLRGKGLGREMIKYMAGLAQRKGCRRIEWVCLDWNEPSIRFYKNLGASSMQGVLSTFRLDGDKIDILNKQPEMLKKS